LGLMREMDAIFAILPEENRGEERLDEVMRLLIDIRRELRKRKMYDLSDMVRDRLLEAGIKLEDTTEGTKWKLL